MPELKDLIIEVVKVEGSCAAGYKVGDKIYISGANVDLQKSTKVCYWALSSIMPLIFSMQSGIEPSEFGFSDEKGVAYIACSDIGKPYTRGGRVIFKVIRA